MSSYVGARNDDHYEATISSDHQNNDVLNMINDQQHLTNVETRHDDDDAATKN